MQPRLREKDRERDRDRDSESERDIDEIERKGERKRERIESCKQTRVETQGMCRVSPPRKFQSCNFGRQRLRSNRGLPPSSLNPDP